MSELALVRDTVVCLSKAELVATAAKKKGLVLRNKHGSEERDYGDSTFFTLPVGKFDYSIVIPKSFDICSTGLVTKGGKEAFFELEFKLVIREDGVEISPRSVGASCCRCFRSVTEHLFAAILQSYENVHPFIEECLNKRLVVFVPWSDLEEEGMRSVSMLFNQFSGGNPAILDLALSSLSPFSVSPCSDAFVPSSSQPALSFAWAGELRTYISSLKI